MEFTSLVEHITQAQGSASHPIVVGVSGYAGSGKSTLARRLVEAVPGTVRMRGDDFLNPVLSHHGSQDWAGVERIRLAEEVLKPIRGQQPGTFRRFDWSLRALGDPEPLPAADVLVVDLIGLFHPDALEHLDITVWCDIDLPTAIQRGMARDRELGRMHDALWREVWEPNERDFAERFAPAQRADTRFSTEAASGKDSACGEDALCGTARGLGAALSAGGDHCDRCHRPAGRRAAETVSAQPSRHRNLGLPHRCDGSAQRA